MTTPKVDQEIIQAKESIEITIKQNSRWDITLALALGIYNTGLSLSLPDG